MKIDGRQIALQIKENLKIKINSLKSKRIYPHLAVILLGNDPASQIYVRRKKKAGEELGLKISNSQFPIPNSKEKLYLLVKNLNNNPTVHGIIIQRPVPVEISKEEINNIVRPEKDVDGFHPSSKFNPPVALAVWKILKWVCDQDTSEVAGWSNAEAMTPRTVEESGQNNVIDWINKKKILVIGRGETAGKPIAKYLQKIHIPITIAHSKTLDLKGVCLKSDIIISCVGMPDILRRDMVRSNSIVIGVGLHSENGKLQTDYNQEEIAQKAAFYSPVPGGVGPVNVACLMENLVKAAEFVFSR